MKLGNLKSMIRSTKGSPVLQIELSPGSAVTVALMKGPLLVALDEAFPGGKAVETGMTLETKGDDAVLRPEVGGVYAIKASAPGPLLAIMETPVGSDWREIKAQIESQDATNLMLSLPMAPVTLLDLDDDLPPAPPSAPKATTLLLDL